MMPIEDDLNNAAILKFNKKEVIKHYSQSQEIESPETKRR